MAERFIFLTCDAAIGLAGVMIGIMMLTVTGSQRLRASNNLSRLCYSSCRASAFPGIRIAFLAYNSYC